MRLAALLALSCALAGCKPTGGAVSVRWRIVDFSSGDSFDPNENGAADGSCCRFRDQSNLCEPGNVWVVHNVQLVLTNPITGEDVPLPGDGSDGTFLCSQRERTTQFDIQPATYAMSLTALVTSGTGMPTHGEFPPPQMDTVVSGDVVNLQAVEIGVNPLPVP
jgi:hypothetical protein